MAPFMVFNLWTGPSFIYMPCSKLLIFQLQFSFELDLFSSTYLNKLIFLWCSVIENTSIEGSTRLRACCLKPKQSRLQKRHACLKSWRMDKAPKKKNVSVSFSHILLPLLDFSTVEDGTNRLSQNISTESPLYAVKYLRKMQISHDDSVLHALILFRVVQFRAIQFGTIWFSVSYMNFKWPQIFKCPIQGKISSCISVNTVIQPLSDIMGFHSKRHRCKFFLY
jgi:hypothetical protein